MTTFWKRLFLWVHTHTHTYVYIDIHRESNKSVNLIYATVTKDNCIAKLAVIRDLTYAVGYTVYDNTQQEILSKIRET